MTRRPVALATSVLALLTLGLLSSCSTLPDSSTVASVDDDELSQEEFDAILRNPVILVPGQQLPSAFPGDDARSIIGIWIEVQVLGDSGMLDPVTDEQARALLDSAPAEWDTGASEVPFLVDLAKRAILIDSGGLDTIALAEALSAADVTVGSRYGVWTDEGGVQPIGAQPE